ncbi:hypothetical protein KC929_01580 [Patescibacteria group bacterium]|nr:hypothetical protein [Patescibacteria group bacterium]
MSKILRILLSIFFGIAAGFMLISIIPMLNSSEINPELTDSLTDKIMFCLLMLGCAGVLMTFAIGLWRNLPIEKPFGEKKFSSILFFTSFLFFIVGIYYSFMFGSPW